MSKAKFKELTGDMVGLIRVFDVEPDGPTTPYKFFTAAIITSTEVEIEGMRDSNITHADVIAMAEELITHPKLGRLNLQSVSWTHNGRRQRFDLNKVRKRLSKGG